MITKLFVFIRFKSAIHGPFNFSQTAFFACALRR
jgi:hypothetical protein